MKTTRSEFNLATNFLSKNIIFFHKGCAISEFVGVFDNRSYFCMEANNKKQVAEDFFITNFLARLKLDWHTTWSESLTSETRVEFLI